MTRIAIDPNFTGGFNNRVGGTGAVSVTNSVLKCTGSGGDSAMKDYFFPITGGTNITIMIEARSIQGEARVALDYVNTSSGTQLNFGYDYTTSNEWSILKIDIVVPFGLDTKTGCLVLGKFGSQNQTVDVEFRNPELYIENSFGSPLTIAQGLIGITGGVPSVNSNFKSYGIKGFEVGTYHVKIFLEHDYLNRPSHRPLIQVSGTSDNPLVPLIGQFDSSDDSLTVKFSNGTSFISIATLGNMYFSLLVHL